MIRDLLSASDGHITDREAADWEADDSDVRSASMHYENDALTLDHNLEEVNLDLHVNHGQEVSLVASDDSTDEWRSVVVDLGPDAAAKLAEQLQLAAQFAREDEQADIRI